jgi:hypothetical protein
MNPDWMPIPMRYTVAADAPVKFEFANPQEFAEWLDRVRPLQGGSALPPKSAPMRVLFDDLVAANARLRSKLEVKNASAQSLEEALDEAKASRDAVITQNQELRAEAKAHEEARERAEKDLAAVLEAIGVKDAATAREVVLKMRRVCDLAEAPLGVARKAMAVGTAIHMRALEAEIDLHGLRDLLKEAK